jgi:bifunctional non-homologous end joining protein LigD
MSLEEYRRKRDFRSSPEPLGGQSAPGNIFVIQKHHARRLHFDFRIEEEGVLKSWALPKGLPGINEKRLAVQTEDHPLDYAKFKGIIPEGYGAGKVEIHDNGRYANLSQKDGKRISISQAIDKGHVRVWIKGRTLDMGLSMVKMKDKDWLVTQFKEEKADEKNEREITDGKREITLTNLRKELFPAITKGEYLSYYENIASFMLPHLKGRPLSLYRFPNGPNQGFYQKNIQDYFPAWLDTVKIKEVRYPLAKDRLSLLFLANLVGVFHPMTSRKETPELPDRMVFDLDPSLEDLSLLRRSVRNLVSLLRQSGLSPYVMTTGGKGYHIVVPIKPELDHGQVRAFASKVAEVMAAADQENLTTELSKKKRQGRVFIDVNRNSPGQTSVAPYSVRADPEATVAAPFDIEDLEMISPRHFSISNLAIDKDPWEDIDMHRVSLRAIIEGMKR